MMVGTEYNMPKTILITGACGFLGINLTNYVLDNTDWDIISVDYKNTRPINNKRVIDYCADISRKNELEKIKESFDYVVHFAAQKDVTMSFVNIEPYILTNVVGTSRFFTWLREREGIKKIINFSTAAVMGANKGIHTHEFEPYDPMNPYASTKACQEIIGIVYRNLYKLPIVSVRIDTPFGFNQPERNFIPSIIKNILSNKPVTLYKKDTQKLDSQGNKIIYPASRCWIFTEILSNELLKILQSEEEKHLYHIVGNNYTVKQIFDKIEKIIGNGTKIEWRDCYENSITSDQHLEYGISSTSPDIPGGSQDFDFDEQIAETVAWYKKYFKEKKHDNTK
jgi:nucleoside-diphosphate-sugar epimerase